ncbi:MAG TPA: hypothetical protein VFI46_00565 [Jiangellaceae bacterium]|nr:hypothetical protein [Jiangellaceae bacterium]
MSPHHFRLVAPVPRSRGGPGGGNGTARLSGRVRHLDRFFGRATSPWRAMLAATVFSGTTQPRSRS